MTPSPRGRGETWPEGGSIPGMVPTPGGEKWRVSAGTRFIADLKGIEMKSDTDQSVIYREATTADLLALAELRWEMEVERHGQQFSLDVYSEAFVRSMRDDMERGHFRSWLAEAGGRPVACVVLIWWPTPPHFENLNRKRGFVSSVYTRPDYRRRGIGRELMQTLVATSREMGIQRLILWASEMGRPLYEELGFTDSGGMEFNI